MYTDDEIREALWRAFVRHGGPWGSGRDLAIWVDDQGRIVRLIEVPDDMWWLDPVPVPPPGVSLLAYPGCTLHDDGWRSWRETQAVLATAPAAIRRLAAEAATAR